MVHEYSEALPAPIRLAKSLTGIPGFDAITDGGLPAGRTTLLVGGPGTGKTVFALQTLVNGVRRWNEPGIFVAFEEHSNQLRANAATLGWDLATLRDDQLFFLDAQLSPSLVKVGDFDLAGLLAGLSAQVQAMQAKRIVFDGLDVLLFLLNDPLAERQEVYRLHDWLLASGLTGILTAKHYSADAGEEQPYPFLEFMADCVVLLTHRPVARVGLRSLRVQKYRGSSFADSEFPLAVGTGGMEVAGLEPSEDDMTALCERLSTGLPRLDAMLTGGYYRGSSVLISGSPGTAKSTLASLFIEAACRRGERACYVSFDEAGGEILRNVASVNIHLAPHVQAGLLRLQFTPAELHSAEEHLLAIRILIETHQPRVVVIDPLSALIKAGGEQTALLAAHRLLRLCKKHGITLLYTSLLAIPDGHTETAPMQISTLADTWIHLSYLVSGGERNRALTVIKARGTRHSNQVRELLLSDAGVTLMDVYTAGGEVLLGTARWEKEQAQALAAERDLAELEDRQREHEFVQAETHARLEALQHTLALQQLQMARLHRDQDTRRRQIAEQQQTLYTRRRGDHPDASERSAQEPPEGTAGARNSEGT